MIQSTCPSEDTLNRLLSDVLEDSRYESLNQHLEECIACQSRLDALTDSPVGVSLPVSNEHDAAISKLVSRLSSLSPSELESLGSGTSSTIRFPGPPTEESPLGELTHYQIQELIGSGSSGMLYRAIDSKVDREVAIKVLRSELVGHEESRKRFRREARAVAGLNHEGVVQLYEFVDTGDFPPYLVMEYVEGQSIADLLKQHKVIPTKQSVAMAIPIARALAKAHQNGLVHRDIKPSNILLGNDSQPKVTDFGLALLDDGNATLTREGALAGTPAYISPEQIVAPHQVDGRSDVFSLGVVLYRMLTGQLPFQGVTRMMLLAVLHKDPPSPTQYNDEIPRDVETIVLKALSKDRDKRYETAAAMADDLQRWVDGEPIHARPVGRLERLTRWCKRKPRIAKLSATVAALLVLMAVGSVVASFNLSVAQNKTEAERDRAFKFLDSLIGEIQNQAADNKIIAASPLEKTMLDISLQGVLEITDGEDDRERLGLSTARVKIMLCHALLMDNDVKSFEVQLEEASKVLQNLGGENSDQWPVVELCIEQKKLESDYYSLRQQPERAMDKLQQALSIAKKSHQRWPDNFVAHLSLARTQHLIFTDPSTRQNTPTDATELLNTLEDLERTYPKNEKVAGLLIQTHRDIATFAMENNDDSTALASYQTIIERHDALKQQESPTVDLSELEDLKPAIVSAYHNLGEIYKKRGDKENAVRHYQEFMNFQKQRRYGYFEIGKVQDVKRYIDRSKKRYDDNLIE